MRVRLRLGTNKFRVGNLLLEKPLERIYYVKPQKFEKAGVRTKNMKASWKFLRLTTLLESASLKFLF